MRTSENTADLAAALAKAQGEVGSVKKDAANDFLESSYSTLDAVIKAIKGPLAKNSLSYTQTPLMQDGWIGVTTRLMHSGGQWVEGDSLVPLTKSTPQTVGASLTYARRYGLLAITGVASEDDDGQSIEAEVQIALINNEQAAVIEGLMMQLDDGGASFLKFANLGAIDDMASHDFERLASALDRKIASQEALKNAEANA